MAKAKANVKTKQQNTTTKTKQPETIKPEETTTPETESKPVVENKPEETPAPKVEETKPEGTKPVNKKLTVNEVINNAKTLEEALTGLEKIDNVKDLAIGVRNYVKTISGETSPQSYAAANFRFYTLLTTQLNTANYGLFKVRFETILKLFGTYEQSVLNAINVLKYDHFWRYGGKSRAAYGMLISFIDAVKKPNTRKKELAKINFKTFGDYLPTTIVSNIQRYFKL